MEEFHALFTMADINFGYPLQDKDDTKHGRFVFLKLPKDYRCLILEGRKMTKESGLFALVFLLDLSIV
jgi:hypothetical protein